MDWKPIESAPKDGTEIDIWQYCHDPAWRPNKHGLDKGFRITNVRWADSTWQTFSEEDGDWYDVTNEHYTVSHWMELPAPPSPSTPSGATRWPMTGKG